MKKREDKFEFKFHEKEVKTHHTANTLESSRKVHKIAPAFDGNADFLSFSDVDLDKYTKKNKAGVELLAPPTGSSDSIDDIEARISKKYDRDQYPWVSDFTLKVKDAFLFLHNEILDFVKFIESTPEDLKARKKVVKRVKQVVRSCYPEAQVMVFGSCATGLNLPNSDIDVLVYLPEVNEKSMINKITQALLKSGICKSIDPLKHAKVPIIKL